jgi:hypothetical protein
MSLQFVDQLERVADLAVELDRSVPRDCERLAVGRERMVRNRVVKKVMDFRSSHLESECDRSSSLLPLAEVVVGCECWWQREVAQEGR